MKEWKMGLEDDLTEDEIKDQIKDSIKKQASLMFDSIVNNFMKKLEESPKVFFERMVKSNIVLKNRTGINLTFIQDYEKGKEKEPDKFIIELRPEIDFSKVNSENNDELIDASECEIANFFKNGTELNIKITNNLDDIMEE